MVPLLNFFRLPSQSVLDAATVSACSKVNGMDYSNIRMYMSAGFAVMNVVYSPLIAWFGIGFPFYAMVGFTVIMFLSRKVLKTYETDSEEPRERHTGSLDLSRLYKNYYLVVFLVINVLMMIPMNAGMMLTYLIKEIGANTNNIGYITGVRVFAEIIALLLSTRIKRVLSQPMMMVIASVLFLMEMTGYQIAGSFVTVGLTAMLGGAGFGLVLSTGYTYVNSLAPKGLEATAISLYSIGLSAAGVLTSFIGGQIVVHLGVRTLYFYSFFCVVLWLIVFFASYFIGEKVLKKPAPLPLFRRLKD
jgi:PPP family 3-phenylpropionic acid transporter